MDASAAVRTLVAHLYQRSGKHAHSENELVNAVSLDLKWFAPKDARALVASLAREGHLQRNEDGELEPGFVVKEVKVPLGFRPPPDLLYAMPPATDLPASPGVSTSDPAPIDLATDAAGHAHPDPRAAREVAEPPAHGLGALLAAVAAEAGDPPGEWAARMNELVQASADQLTPEAALLLAAAEAGLDVSAWLPGARAGLRASS